MLTIEIKARHFWNAICVTRNNLKQALENTKKLAHFSGVKLPQTQWWDLSVPIHHKQC